MKHILTTLKASAFTLLLMVTAATTLVPATGVHAVDPKDSLCEGAGGGTNGADCSTTGPTVMETIANITNILLYIAGAIAVVMVIIGGVRYATSQGDQSSITAAKNTVLYAIVGLIVTFAAYAIVNFVLRNL